MTHARLTHKTRPTLEFRQGQQDEYERQAVTTVFREVSTERESLVHTTTEDNRRVVRGAVTAPRRAANDPDTSDWRQALANYADELEAHANEFQGVAGYTFEGDELGYSKRVILESIEWSLNPGKPFELEWQAKLAEGRGTVGAAGINRSNPTVDSSMDVYCTVDGNDLPGMREFTMRKEIGTNVKGVFDRDTAENNDVLIEEGPQQLMTFVGVHSGTLTERQNADQALDKLVATKNNVTLATKFPGYDLDGFVTAYKSSLEQQRGGESHRYRLEFMVGQRA